MTVTVRLPTQLREYANGQATVELDGTTVGEILTNLGHAHPGVGRRVTDEQGRIRRHVHVYIGEDRARTTDDTVPPNAEITIMPAVSGG